MSPEDHRRGRRRGELTVATIARLAGVSTATVSKVLNGRAGVSPGTRQRVEALLHEHDYRRPESILPVPSIEVVFFGLHSHLAIEVLRGVEQVARPRDLGVGFLEVRDPSSGGRPWTEQVLSLRPTGVIAVLSKATPLEQGRLATAAIPVVALDPTGEPSHPTPSVGTADWSGGITAARHLLELGHRRIAVITGPTVYLSARARLEGCRAAMETAGVPLDPRLVRTGRYFFETGRELGRELLALPDPPTAVLCGDDLQALGVYDAARQAGLRIPDDLSVVGFDDMEYARWCGPPMTTVRQPFADMAAAATEIVLALAAGEPPTGNRVELATTLIVRGSTAPPRLTPCRA